MAFLAFAGHDIFKKGNTLLNKALVDGSDKKSCNDCVGIFSTQESNKRDSLRGTVFGAKNRFHNPTCSGRET